jgi:hypothetical protein
MAAVVAAGVPTMLPKQMTMTYDCFGMADLSRGVPFLRISTPVVKVRKPSSAVYGVTYELQNMVWSCANPS